MPRLKLIRSTSAPYHITCRSNNQEWFPIDQQDFWQLVGEIAALTREKYKIQWHAVVQMANHLHALVTTPEANLDVSMNYFMRELSKTGNRRAGRKNHLFGGPYHWTIIGSDSQYAHTYRYIYRNPVRAGLCSRVEEFPWSTIQTKLGRKSPPFPLENCRLELWEIFRSNNQLLLDWLNTTPLPELDQAIQYALRWRVFRLHRDRNSRCQFTLPAFDAL